MSPRFVPASVAELSRVGVLASLPGETLTKLAERMRREDVPPGTRIVSEGADDGGRFFVLLSGIAAVTQADRGPRSLLRPGETFGEVAATLGVARTATVTAVTQCTIASCDRETFDELVRSIYADDEA